MRDDQAMTDRHSGYVITLDRDIREDDAEATLTALRMTRGVASVKPIVADLSEMMARERVKSDARMALHEAIEKVFGYE